MRRFFVGLFLVLTLTAAACASDGPDAGVAGGSEVAPGLTVYSGRAEELMGPIVEQFEGETGIDVDVRYGDTARLADTIVEEGDTSPADLYLGEDVGALGALSEAGRLQGLDPSLLERVDPQYRATNGRWVGISGRARVAVYSTNALRARDLPESVLDFTDPKWGGGRLGWAPTSVSFQAFVTALRVNVGEDGARAWLEGIRANEPTVFEDDASIVKAAGAGEIDVGFVNHNELNRILADDPNLPAANHFFANGDVGSQVNVAGVGIVDTADHVDEATQLVDFLLGKPVQEYLVAEAYEIPLIDGVENDADLPPLASLQQPEIALNRLDDRPGTLELMTEVGLI